MLNNYGVLSTFHSHLQVVLHTFTFLVILTSRGIHTKSALKLCSTIIIIFSTKIWHLSSSFFCVKVYIILRWFLGILSSITPSLLCHRAFIVVTPLLLCYCIIVPSLLLCHCCCVIVLLCHHYCVLTLLCLHDYYASSLLNHHYYANVLLLQKLHHRIFLASNASTTNYYNFGN
jgi:hypothetical protein